MRSLLRGVGIKRAAPIVLVILAALFLAFSGCQGLPSDPANCVITPTPPSNLSTVPPAQEPPPAALCGFPLTISGPTSGASVSAPFALVAAATPTNPIYTVRTYVDGQAVLYTPKAAINQLIWMPNGQHTLEVVAEDTAGHIATASIQPNVIGQEPGVLNIQSQNSWVSCSALIANSTCAAGLGTATSSLTLNQSTPSLDGSAAKFSLAGNHPYSNERYWIPLGGGNSVSRFTYDLWFYIDSGDAPQSLEFDVNQAFDGTRWTWGSQCDFNQTHQWNVWDPLHEVWVPIPVVCNYFPSQTWIHLIWTLERVGNQVHYVTLSVAEQTHNIDVYFTAQPKWYQEEIDVAFQMDGNYKQQPYNVWLDKVSLLAN